MVLARKRSRLSLMQTELQALNIASQQPEKTNLADAPEVQDIIALLDVLVSPTHDLSLARALKSPLFGLTDDDLVAIALAYKATNQIAAVLHLRLRYLGLIYYKIQSISGKKYAG